MLRLARRINLQITHSKSRVLPTVTSEGVHLNDQELGNVQINSSAEAQITRHHELTFAQW